MVAIYARQSLDKKDSLSIEGQVELCQKYAGGEACVFQDRGFSGKNTKRPAFLDLMDRVRAGEIKKILVYRLDRFSRSIADFSQIWTELEKHGVEFQSVTEQFDTSSPMGRAMLNIVMTFAQLERETTAERVKDNYYHRFHLGAWPGGPAPFGFDLVKIRDQEGRLVSSLKANEKSAVVQRIFEAYAEPRMSLRALARQLTEEGVHGPKRQQWDNVTLSRILHSPLYVQATEEVYWFYLAEGLSIVQPPEAFDGSHACNVIGRRNRSKGQYRGTGEQSLSLSNHEGFIAPKLWLSVQDKLKGNRQINRTQAGTYTWLTGLLKCGKCGYAIRVNYGKRENKFYLLCSGRSNLGHCDASIGLNLRELEALVESELVKVLDQCPAEEVWPEENSVTEELQDIDQKIERLVTALAESSTVAVGYISKQIEKLHERKERLLARARQAEGSFPERRKVDFVRASFEEKGIIAREFIDRILVDGDQVNIIWKM